MKSQGNYGGGGGGRGHQKNQQINTGKRSGGQSGGRGDGRGSGRADIISGSGRGGGGRGFHHVLVTGVSTEITDASPKMSDVDILSVISPSLHDRDRSELLAAGPLEKPGHSEQRMTPSIGCDLDGHCLVMVNHFPVDVSPDVPGIPGMIVQHHVHVYRMDREGHVGTEDVSTREDAGVTCYLVKQVLKKNRPWKVAQIGFAYDNKSTLFSTRELELPQGGLSTVVKMKNLDGSESQRRFTVIITRTGSVVTPTSPEEWRNADATVLRALDTALFQFARGQQMEKAPQWLVVGAKIFAATAKKFHLAAGYVGMRGYFASLKSCMAGLVLVVDMSVNCFLVAGEMKDLFLAANCFNNFEDLLRECQRGLAPQVLERILNVVKNAKVKTKHLGHTKKVRGLGPAADHKDSAFPCNGKLVTVAQYFEDMCKGNDPKLKMYREALPLGKLRYPKLPTVDVGSATKRILVPVELLMVIGGQSRSQCMDGPMTTLMIREAAAKPDVRADFITRGQAAETCIVSLLTQDKDAVAFGLSRIAQKMMSTPARVLPPALLQYDAGPAFKVGFKGSWDRPPNRLVNTPPLDPTPNKGFKFTMLVVGDRAPANFQAVVNKFVDDVQKAGVDCGVRLFCDKNSFANSNESETGLTDSFNHLKGQGFRIVFVAMVNETIYGRIKKVADAMGVTTQCLRWSKLTKEVRGYASNVMLKVNFKLGGTNHTLASRLPSNKVPASHPAVFQVPAASLPHVFDRPTMLMGIDVSHPDFSTGQMTNRKSVAAVVASTDRSATKYVAYISAQSPGVEMVASVTVATKAHLDKFKQVNGRYPEHIIVFRDGVSDSQFDAVLASELPALHDALALVGFAANEGIKIAIVVCQKGHHTRLFCEKKESDGSTTLGNPFPGLVVDASGGNQSITSAVYNEFYLNSHAAIQGTSKPCKYALIYDEIGFKLSELELLTYWSTFLYARCNKSVSYATPAYYAHWASKRGKEIVAAGGSDEDLSAISDLWAGEDMYSGMFFL